MCACGCITLYLVYPHSNRFVFTATPLFHSFFFLDIFQTTTVLRHHTTVGEDKSIFHIISIRKLTNKSSTTSIHFDIPLFIIKCSLVKSIQDVYLKLSPDISGKCPMISDLKRLYTLQATQTTSINF